MIPRPVRVNITAAEVRDVTRRVRNELLLRSIFVAALTLLSVLAKFSTRLTISSLEWDMLSNYCSNFFSTFQTRIDTIRDSPTVLCTPRMYRLYQRLQGVLSNVHSLLEIAKRRIVFKTRKSKSVTSDDFDIEYSFWQSEMVW